MQGCDSCEAANKAAPPCEKNADDEIPHSARSAHPGASGRASAARASSSTASNVNISATLSRGTGRAPTAIPRSLPKQGRTGCPLAG